MQVFFAQRQELAPTIWQYNFTSQQPVDFVAGQYVDVRLPVSGDPRGPSRTFTLISLPGESMLSFIVKILDPHSLYKSALSELASGAMVTVGESMGDLVLPKDPRQPLIFVAGGIGIASYASVLKQLTASKEIRSISLFYSLRDSKELILSDLIDGYSFQTKQIIVAPEQLSAAQVKKNVPEGALVYISGSQNFVEVLRTDLEALGVPRAQIVFDYYDGYAEL